MGDTLVPTESALRALGDAREALLERYGVLDTPPEQAFDDIVLLASKIAETPVALVSLVTTDRQWFKARIGFPACETSLGQSVCAHALNQNETFVIPDLTLDPRTRDNSLVTGPPFIRFYAGALLHTPEGTPIGTLCVIDTEPRPAGLTEHQRISLEALARQVMSQLELRRLISRQADARGDLLAAKASADQQHAEAVRLAALVEQSGDFIGAVTPGGEVLFVNPAGLRLVGLPDLRAAQARPFLDYFADDDHQTVLKTVLPAVQQHDHWEGTLNFRDVRTGVAVPVFTNIFPIRDEQGTVTGYGTVTRDLREVRKSDARRAALLELSDRFRDVEDTGEMAAIASAIVGRAMGVSATCYAAVNAVGNVMANERTWTAPGVGSAAGLHSLQDLEFYIEDLRRGEPVVVDDVRLDPRTAPHAAELEARSARSFITLPLVERGQLVAVFFVSSSERRDWTLQKLSFIRNVAERTQAAIERRRAESSLRELAQSLEQQVAERTADRNRLWQLSTDIMLVAHLDGVVTAVNPAWTVLLGWDKAELLGHSLFELIHPDDRDKAVAGAGSLAAGSTLWRFESRCRHKDGSYRWISWTAVPGAGLINAVGRDVTTEKEQQAALHQTEERLRQSQKMEAVGQLTGGLAHDFNNLLTGITGSLEMLQVRITQGRVRDVDRYVNAAHSAAKRAAALTHRLLAFSRRQTLDPKPTDINRLVADMEELVRRTVGPEIAVEAVAAGGLWNTLVDASQLENALLNLCINARDAMPHGGKLTIETGNRWLDERGARERELPPGQYVTLCVSDNGIGMPTDVIARAFDPFFTTKPIGQGTGLGLSMIYGFARQSGGQVRIYSEVGQGTMVCLYLPRHNGVAAEPDTAPAFAVAPRAGRNETVLVVDDEPTVRMLVTEVLEDLGYTAIEAADGAAGLRLLQSGVRVDLLVTDVGLPGGMNGRQVADAARVARPELKVLFITGYAENAALSHGHLEPGMHVLTKPFAMEALASRIKDLLTGK